MNLGSFQPGAASLSLQFAFHAFQVETDAQGRFTFPKVPPGKWQLVRFVPIEIQGGHSSWSGEPVQEVEVAPGQTLSLTLGAGARRVSARFRFPAGFERKLGMHLFASIDSPFPNPPAELRSDPDALQKWTHSPEIAALAQKARRYPLHENADGTWSADEVLPGQYVLNASLMPSQSTPGAKPLMAATPVTIPDGVEPLDMGEVALQAAPY